MLAPLSWLKDYVNITLPIDKLIERLMEVGIGVEGVKKEGSDTIFELEITPNRPDLLCIVGIAREIAAIEDKKIKLSIPAMAKPAKKMPFSVKNDFSLLEHYASVVISNITIKESPEWIQARLVKLGLRPINNVVDITNYVMFELGIPLHAFDYDDIHGHEFTIEKSKGGEEFESVDEIKYRLPKDAIIIRDKDRVVDLVGIKGGLNSGIKKTTKNVLLQTSVDNPTLIRRASQNLALRSDASNILEKGIDKAGLLPALNRAANLILDLAGGSIGSEIFELKEKEFKPWKVTLRLSRLKSHLGIDIPKNETISLLTRLNFEAKVKNEEIEVIVPAYRNDIQMEEDVIEEVARLYGYNRMPQTILGGNIPVKKVPYAIDYSIEQKAKGLLAAAGFSEIRSYSLLSEADLVGEGYDPLRMLRVDNPVSREYEYLRPTLLIHLKKALAQNIAIQPDVQLFELGKVYLGKSLDETEEPYFLSGITNTMSFLEVKGVLETLFDAFGVHIDPTESIKSTDEGVTFELNFSELLEKGKTKKTFKPVPKYPPIIEDMAILIQPGGNVGEIIQHITKQNPLIDTVSLLDEYESTRTFRIVYQHKERNLTKEEVSEIREKILKTLKEKFHARLKD